MFNPFPRIAGIIVRPKTTFAEARDEPLRYILSIYLMIVVLSVLSQVIYYFTSSIVEFPIFIVIFLNGVAFPFLDAIAGTLIGIGVLAIITRIAGARGTLLPAAKVFLYASIPMALVTLVMVVMDILLYQILSSLLSILLFVLFVVAFIWTLILGIIGLKAIFRFSTKYALAFIPAEFCAIFLLNYPNAFWPAWSLSIGGMVFRYVAITALCIAIFGLHRLTEQRQLVHESKHRWSVTQLFSWIAIVVLIISYQYFPIYLAGGYSMMSELSERFYFLMDSPLNSLSTIELQELAMIAIIGGMIIIFFLHAIGIAGRKVPILAALLSFVYLIIAGSYIGGWASFYSIYSDPVVPFLGTWIVPLLGLSYIIIERFWKADSPPPTEEGIHE